MEGAGQEGRSLRGFPTPFSPLLSTSAGGHNCYPLMTWGVVSKRERSLK